MSTAALGLCELRHCIVNAPAAISRQPVQAAHEWQRGTLLARRHHRASYSQICVSQSVPSAAVALKHYVIMEASRKLDLVYSNVTEPAQLMGFLSATIVSTTWWTSSIADCSMSSTPLIRKTKKTLHLTAPNNHDSISIEPLTTYAELIGVCLEHTSKLGSYYAPTG